MPDRAGLIDADREPGDGHLRHPSHQEAQARKLEEISGLTRGDAKRELTAQLEHDAKMDASKLIRRIEARRAAVAKDPSKDL